MLRTDTWLLPANSDSQQIPTTKNKVKLILRDDDHSVGII